MSSSNNIQSIVDLSQRATQLAAELGSLQSFLGAAQSLLTTCENLPPAEIKQHARKIVALTEVARSTLKAAGLKLYSFASCSPSCAPYKALYFDLLRALSARRHLLAIESGLRGRLNKLLLPLSEGFVIERKFVQAKWSRSPMETSTSHSLVLPPQRISKGKCRAADDGMASHSSALMPPPDAFPPDRLRKETSCGRKNKDGWWPKSPRSQPCRHNARDEDDDSDNSSDDDSDSEDECDDEPAPLVAPIRPRPYRFGIFCTPKRSMHQQREQYPLRERAGRSRTVRPIRRE